MSFIRQILPLFLFSTLLLSYNARAFEPSMFTSQTPQQQTPSPEPIAAPEAFAKSLFLSHAPLPERIYLNQVFSLTLKAIVARDDYKTLETEFGQSQDVTVLNPQSPWVLESNNVFTNTFYFKASSSQAQLPRITLFLSDNGITVESDILSPQPLSIVSLNHNASFSGVVAESLHVKRFKTSRFDGQHLIMVIEIDAFGANLEDFSLGYVAKQGIDSFSGEFPEEKIIYFAIFEDHRERLEFNYFDLKNNRFERIVLPIVVDAGDVSTQIGLNPKESPFQMYKNASALVVAALFLLLYAFRRRILYLLLSLAFSAYYAYSISPFSQITIKPDTRVRIIPTERSTIFFTTEDYTRVEYLGSTEEYLKILLPTGKIGWIKEENVSKD